MPAGQPAPLQLPVSAQNGGTGSVNGDGTGLFFPAKNYGSCVWDGATGHDVGPCVNAAIAAAAAAGGGTVTVQAGVYYFATQIQQTHSNVGIKGAGWGHERDATLPYDPAATRLVYNGTALTGQTPAVYIGPVAGASAWRVSVADVKDIVFDGGGLASVVIKINNADYSTFRFGCYNPAQTGDACTWVSAEAGNNQIGTQQDDFWLSADTDGPAGNSTATAILIDGKGGGGGSTTLSAAMGATDTSTSIASATDFPASGPNLDYIIQIDSEYIRVTGGQGTTTWTVTRGVNGSTAAAHSLGATVTSVGANPSYNRFHLLSAHFNAGDGIVFGNADTNTVDMIESYHDGVAITGSAVVFANSGYIPPSGFQVSNRADNIHVFGMMGASSHVQGLTSGSLWQVVTSAGTGHLNTQTLTTNAASSNPFNTTLSFPSVTNVYAGETMNCGGQASGVYPQMMVIGSSATTVIMQSPVAFSGGVNGVTSGTTCTFSYGIAASAVPGTYNLAYNGSSFKLTAPAGGATQSGVNVSGGMLNFTDMWIPFTGTPVAGDNWNIVVPTQASRIVVDNVDRDNWMSFPYLEPGTFGSSYKTPDNLLPTVANRNQGAAASATNFFGGFGPTQQNVASGQASWAEGGQGNSATSYLSSVFGGADNVVSGGTAAGLGGSKNTLTGNFSAYVGGQGGNDFTRINSLIHSYGAPNGNGSAQGADYGMYATATSTTTVNPTANGNAASTTNCLNLTATQGVAFSAQMIAFDRTTSGKVFTAGWGAGSAAPHVLTRGASNATTLLDGVTTAVAPDTTRALGSITGQSAALQANTTLGCVTASFTPPTGNTDTWTVVVRFHTVEAQ